MTSIHETILGEAWDRDATLFDNNLPGHNNGSLLIPGAVTGAAGLTSAFDIQNDLRKLYGLLPKNSKRYLPDSTWTISINGCPCCIRLAT